MTLDMYNCFLIITQEGAGNMCFFIEKYITNDNSKLEFLDPWYCVKVIVRTQILIINCNSSQTCWCIMGGGPCKHCGPISLH
jgi:hypothetical protein